jgi:hypothetical protein
MGVDDMVTELELDELDFACYLELDVELFLLRCLWRNGVSFVRPATRAGPSSSLQVTIHEVDLLQPAQSLANVLGSDLPNSLD